MNRYSPAADVKATSYMAANGDGAYYLAADVDARIAELEKALDKADEAMAFELGGEPLPTLMIEARAMIAALKGAVLCVPCAHCSRHVPIDWPACGHCGEHRQPVTKSVLQGARDEQG